jgi:hypothetical protein
MLLAVTGLGVWWYMSKQPREAPAPPPLTPEAKAYTRNLQLSNVQMKATANYAGATVVEIVGNITNAGDRPINRVELNCVFYDPYSQVVLRERIAIVRSLLGPGETKEFRLPFEELPGSWNQAMPNLVIAHIDFAG